MKVYVTKIAFRNIIKYYLLSAFFLSYQAAYSIVLQNYILSADEFTYDQNLDLFYAKDHILITQNNNKLFADEFVFDPKKNLWKFKGIVKLESTSGYVITGDNLIAQSNFNYLKLNNIFLNFPDQSQSIIASQIVKNDQETYFEDLCYTGCRRDVFKNPIWQFKTQKSTFDEKKQTVKAKNLYLEFFGVPIFFTPYLKYTGPKSQHQSGFLFPSIQSGKTLNLPIYFRKKTNMDLTITPRIKLKPANAIFEAEFNHLISQGNYNIKASIMRSKEFASKYNDSHFIEYSLFSKGNFHIKSYDIAFDIKRTRTPGYLKKYYNVQDSYLVSSISAQQIKGLDYTKFEALDFEDLTLESEKPFLVKDSYLAPFIRSKRVFTLGDNLYLSIKNNNLFYKDFSKYKVARSSNTFNLNKTYQIQDHHLDINLYDKVDLYSFSNNINDQKRKGQFIRNLTELHTTWRYQIFNGNILIEPIASFHSSLSKYKPLNIPSIDSDKNYLVDDHNIFYYNRFSGKDYDENKKRLSYGLNLRLVESSTYAFFIGKKHDLYNYDKSEIVGSSSITTDKLELYYKFNLSNKLKNNLSQLGISSQGEKFKYNFSIFNLRDLKNNRNRILGMGGNIKYILNDNWSIRAAANIDLAGKFFPLNKSLEVTYNYDCIKIFARIASNFSKGGLGRKNKKTWSDFSLQIGLKSLNI